MIRTSLSNGARSVPRFKRLAASGLSRATTLENPFLGGIICPYSLSSTKKLIDSTNLKQRISFHSNFYFCRI